MWQEVSRCHADTHLDLGSVVEVGRAHGLACDVPVIAAGVDVYLLLCHDFQQLCTHLLRLPQPCVLQKGMKSTRGDA